MPNNEDSQHILENSWLKSSKSEITPSKTIYFGYVLDNNDPFDGGRIRVRVPELDKFTDDTSDTLLAFPLISKVGDNTIPKRGESVIVILSDPTKPYSLRFWVGPVISQYQNITNDLYQNALSLTNKASVQPLEPISSIPSANGVFPTNNPIDKENLTTIGRDNTEIKHRKNKIVVKAGKHKTDNPIAKNDNASYLLNLLGEDNEKSYSALVSDIVLLLSYRGESFPKKIDELDESDLKKIQENGYSLVKGEVIVTLLKKMLLLLLTHTHPYNNMETSKQTDLATELLNFDFNTLISKNHIIN